MKKSKTKTLDPATQLAKTIIDGMEDKKAKRIVMMDLRNVSGAIADYFVICTGTSDTHVQAVADSIEDKVRETLGEKPRGREGLRSGEWVLLDYVNVIAHVFLQQKRDFFDIEGLWGDAEFTEIGD